MSAESELVNARLLTTVPRGPDSDHVSPAAFDSTSKYACVACARLKIEKSKFYDLIDEGTLPKAKDLFGKPVWREDRIEAALRKNLKPRKPKNR